MMVWSAAEARWHGRAPSQLGSDNGWVGDRRQGAVAVGIGKVGGATAWQTSSVGMVERWRGREEGKKRILGEIGGCRKTNNQLLFIHTLI
jgi:hypothetical protein